jgi:hypothetical protein
MTGVIMPASEWERERNIQDQYLQDQLEALRSKPTVWRKFRLLEVVCGLTCGDPMIEVMDTVPYPVITYRRTVDHPDVVPLPHDATVQDRIEHSRSKLPMIRRGRFTWTPIPNPLPPPDPNAPGLIPAVCQCRSFLLHQEAIFDDLRSGRRKRAVTGTPRGN